MITMLIAIFVLVIAFALVGAGLQKEEWGRCLISGLVRLLRLCLMDVCDAYERAIFSAYIARLDLLLGLHWTFRLLLVCNGTIAVLCRAMSTNFLHSLFDREGYEHRFNDLLRKGIVFHLDSTASKPSSKPKNQGRLESNSTRDLEGGTRELTYEGSIEASKVMKMLEITPQSTDAMLSQTEDGAE